MEFLQAPIISTSRPPIAPLRSTSYLHRYLQINNSSSPDAASQLESLNGLYTRAYWMLSCADQLSGEAGRAIFSQPPARSSAVEVVDITYFDKIHYHVRPPGSRFILRVKQIAHNQVNQGIPLSPDVASIFDIGSYIFTFSVGGADFYLVVIIDPGDTNAEALGKIARAIGAANTGVTTAIIRQSDSIQLNLCGGTGEANAFSLADQTGNLVRGSGIHNPVQTGQDAIFLLNGTIYRQAGNEVSLLDGHLQVNLTGPGTATVTAGSQTVADLVQSLLEAMTSFGSFVTGNRQLSPALSPSWRHLVDQEAALLSKYGLEAGTQEGIGMDTLKFTAELENGSSQAAAAMNGLASRVRDFVRGLTSLPAATLLHSTSTSGTDAAYLSSSAATPWRQPGGSGFWRIA
jgi:hypothetical protein